MGKRGEKLDRIVGIRVAPATYALLEAHAAEHGQTVSAFVRGVLERAAAAEVCTWTRVGGISLKSRGGEVLYGIGGGAVWAHVLTASCDVAADHT